MRQHGPGRYASKRSLRQRGPEIGPPCLMQRFEAAGAGGLRQRGPEVVDQRNTARMIFAFHNAYGG